MWFTTSSGRIELNITLKDALTGFHQGQCQEDVEYLLSHRPYIRRQLAKIDVQTLRDELREYGDWKTEELEDHETNIQRILWIACGDIVEGRQQRVTK